jgi:hypothetical protein
LSTEDESAEVLALQGFMSIRGVLEVVLATLGKLTFYH